MRWFPKVKYQEPRPVDGQEKIITKFLFLPKTLRKPNVGNETRWLEMGRIYMVYHTFSARSKSLRGKRGYWSIRGWAD